MSPHLPWLYCKSHGHSFSSIFFLCASFSFFIFFPSSSSLVFVLLVYSLHLHHTADRVYCKLFNAQYLSLLQFVNRLENGQYPVKVKVKLRA